MIIDESNTNCRRKKGFELSFKSCLVEVHVCYSIIRIAPGVRSRPTTYFSFCAIRSSYLVVLVESRMRWNLRISYRHKGL